MSAIFSAGQLGLEEMGGPLCVRSCSCVLVRDPVVIMGDDR